MRKNEWHLKDLNKRRNELLAELSKIDKEIESRQLIDPMFITQLKMTLTFAVKASENVSEWLEKGKCNQDDLAFNIRNIKGQANGMLRTLGVSNDR